MTVPGGVGNATSAAKKKELHWRCPCQGEACVEPSRPERRVIEARREPADPPSTPLRSTITTLPTATLLRLSFHLVRLRTTSTACCPFTSPPLVTRRAAPFVTQLSRPCARGGWTCNPHCCTQSPCQSVEAFPLAHTATPIPCPQPTPPRRLLLVLLRDPDMRGDLERKLAHVRHGASDAITWSASRLPA
ncbi:hypothetical protein ANO11243_053890 [Dothideomycetidae sp. 11243]|nr:hypothetical protein ANO11243_053890 [fungal sp. No.11243]